MPVRFEWDEAKRLANIRKHGLDFVGIGEVFEGVTATIDDTRFEYGETRHLTIGIWKGRVVAIAHTEHGGVIRIISARRATKYEEKQYLEALGY